MHDEESAHHHVRKLFCPPAFMSLPGFLAIVLWFCLHRGAVCCRASCVDHPWRTHLLLGDQIVLALTTYYLCWYYFFTVEVVFAFPILDTNLL